MIFLRCFLIALGTMLVCVGALQVITEHTKLRAGVEPTVEAAAAGGLTLGIGVALIYGGVR